MTSDREIDRAVSNAAQFAYRLRLHRERTGMTQDQVGNEVHVSGKMIGHLENCRRIPALDTCTGLDHLFDLDAYFEELHTHVTREAEELSSFLAYAEQEEQAASIRKYDPLLIPGLLQTEAYAREVIRAGQISEARIEQLVAVRMSRQERLHGDNPPFLVALIREAAIREVVGGSEVMREQLTRLLATNRDLHCTIQVIPAGAPVYASGSFTLLGYEEGPDIAYAEAVAGHGGLIEHPGQVHALAVQYERIQSETLPASESEKLITSIMESL